MAAAPLRKWQLLLTQLQLLQAKLSAGQACDAAEVRALEYAVADVPYFDAMPLAQVKAAVQEHKVPLRLYTLFAALYPSNPRLGSVFTTAIYRTLSLSFAAPDEQIRQLSPGGALHRTAVALRQQVVASGLLLPPHLPSLLSATAVEVMVGRVFLGNKSHPGQCPAGCINEVTDQRGSSSSRGSRQRGSSSRNGGCRLLSRTDGFKVCRCMPDLATGCLQLLTELNLLWKYTGSGSERGEVLPAAVCAAAMQLVLAVMRQASCLIANLPADWVMADSLLESSFSMACWLALSLLKPCDKVLSVFTLAALDEMEGTSQGLPAVDAEQLLLLQSPHFIQGVGLMVAMTACADLVAAHGAASYLGSSSSGGSGGSNDGSGGSSGGSSSGSCSGNDGGIGSRGERGSGSGSGGGNDGGSGGGAERGSGSSRRGSSSIAWMSGVTTESELRWRLHEQCGTFRTPPSGSGSSDDLAVMQRLYKGQLNVVEGAWDMASSGHQLLPRPIQQLLQLLGVSSKVGMWGGFRMVDRIVKFRLLLPRARALYHSLCDGRHYMMRQAVEQGKLNLLMQHLFNLRIQTYLLPADPQQQFQRQWHLLKSYSAALGLDMQLHEGVQHVLLFWAAKLPDCTDGLDQYCNEVLASSAVIAGRAGGMLEQLLVEFMQEQQQKQQQQQGQEGSIRGGSNSQQQVGISWHQTQQQQQQQGAAEASGGTEVPDLLLKLLQRAMTQLDLCSNVAGKTPAAAAAAAGAAAAERTANAVSNRDRKGKGKSKGGGSSSRRSRQAVAGTNGSSSSSSRSRQQPGTGVGGESSYDTWLLIIRQVLPLINMHFKPPAPAPPAAAAALTPSDAAAGASAAAAAVPVAADPSSTWEQVHQLAPLLERCARQQVAAAAAGHASLVAEPGHMLSIICSIAQAASSTGSNQHGVLLQAALRDGPGSIAARQLFGVLASLLKAGAALNSSGGGSSDSSDSSGGSSSSGSRGVVVAAGVRAQWGQALEQTAEECRVAVAAAVAALLAPSILKHGPPEGTSIDIDSSSDDDSNSDSIGSKWEAVDAAALAPWLVLCGRCFVQWGQQLLSTQGVSHHSFPFSKAGLLQQYNISSTFSVVFPQRLHQQQDRARGAISSMVPGPAGGLSGPLGGSGEVEPHLFGFLSAGLHLTFGRLTGSSSSSGGEDGADSSSSSSIEALSAALQQLQLAHLYECSFPHEGGHQQFGKLLVEVGQLFVGSLPLKSLCCNNPLCANIEGACEAAAASKNCSACRAASYCSSVCQKQHWQQHKRVCSAGLAADRG